MSTEDNTDQIPDEIRAMIGLAISDPGALLKRGDDYTEAISNWSKRAVLKVLKSWLDGKVIVTLPEPDEQRNGAIVWHVGNPLDGGVQVVAHRDAEATWVDIRQPGMARVEAKPAGARNIALAMLAACDEADRLATPAPATAE